MTRDERIEFWKNTPKRELTPAQQHQRFLDLYSSGPVKLGGTVSGRFSAKHPNIREVRRDRP